MTTFLLIRHGDQTLDGDYIAGRRPGVHLREDGQIQARQLARRLGGVRIDAIHASPLCRTRETAAPLAEQRGLQVELCDELLEIDYGEWTGRHLDVLAADERWRLWNAYRSGHRAPGGESMIEVQARTWALVQRLRACHPHDCVALVSHSDVIKVLIAQCLGSSFDLLQRIEISPASVTVIIIEDFGPRIVCMNNTDRLAELPLV